jgi:hypothetical protein
MLDFLYPGNSINHLHGTSFSWVLRRPLADSCFDWLVGLYCFAVRVWDVRPFAPKERCVKIFQGNVHNFEKVSSV